MPKVLKSRLVKSTPLLKGATLANGQTERGNNGVEITELEARSPASAIGLQESDIIVGVNRTRVSTVTELRALMDDADGVIALNVQRGRSSLYLVIR